MKIKLLDFGGLPPTRKHYNDAGADVYADKSYTLHPHSTVKIPLGFGLEIPDGFTGFIFPRSSLSAQGVVCELPPIDSGYRGEVHAVMTNLGMHTYTVAPGDRIGQLVILPVVLPEFVKELGEQRGNGAFGSSGR